MNIKLKYFFASWSILFSGYSRFGTTTGQWLEATIAELRGQDLLRSNVTTDNQCLSYPFKPENSALDVDSSSVCFSESDTGAVGEIDLDNTDNHKLVFA